ncbi:uncharacterized protein LOC108961660 [Serinus canaria]|uniref:uncharacterized protein LOC108961660 n=1 Tax=Serinus canaria TaxID=9135 RepID=UPI0021CC6060|nr:uncharacterized protein LOC108961660 [Serinus canaria]
MKPWDGEARASRRSDFFELKSGTAWQERAAGAASSGSRVERRVKSEPQERLLRAQEWNGVSRPSRRSGLFGLKSGTARQERAAGAASSGSRVERRGKSEPQERPLRAQEWNGEARASFSIGGFGLRSGTARSRRTTRQERSAGAASSGSRVERRGKSEPQERPLRAQEWNGAARASRRSGLFRLKSGTARQERAAGAASSRSRVERRGKSELQHWRLRAQEWNSKKPWDGEARASRRSDFFELKSGTAWQERAAGAASSGSRVERRVKSEPQERLLRAQEWNGVSRPSRRSGLFGLKSGTARQERAAGAASSGSRVERRGKSEPQERPLRAQEWNGEARASFSIGGFGLRRGTELSSSGLTVSSSTFAEAVGRRDKSEPQERPLRAQEWNGEARASRRGGLFGLKSGTARQERAAGAASSGSRVERRGKSELEHWRLRAQEWNSKELSSSGLTVSSSTFAEAVKRRGKSDPQERPLGAQEWNGVAKAIRRSGLFGLKSGTARQERAAGAASSGSRVERRGKSEPQERPLRAQEWNGVARVSFSIGGFGLWSGAARSRGTTRQERQRLRAQEWNGVARASLELKRETRGPLGKGLFQARAPSRCQGRLCAGRPPCEQGWVFAVVGLLPLCSFGCPERGATL